MTKLQAGKRSSQHLAARYQTQDWHRIDKATDAVIQKVIRDVFSGSTVVMIAHRLENIVDFDRIAVLDSGRVIEFDRPEILLARPASAFRALVNGHREADPISEAS